MQLWVWSDSTQPVSCQVSCVGADFEALSTQRFVLQPGQWNELCLFLPEGGFSQEQLLGFGLLIEAQTPSQFYLDDWSVTLQP